MRTKASLFLVLLTAIAAGTACSSTSSSSTPAPPCNENPWGCPAGQTCWPKDTTAFVCLNSGPGKAGAACQNVPASPTCGDGLACLQTTAAGGTCTPYCSTTDTAHTCTGGATCQTALLAGSSGPEFHVCYGGAPPGDAGAD
jgi:hypothetical protein